MTPAEIIALAVLESYAGPWYVAGTDTQRARVLSEAARAIEPLLDQIRREARQSTAANPT